MPQSYKQSCHSKSNSFYHLSVKAYEVKFRLLLAMGLMKYMEISGGLETLGEHHGESKVESLDFRYSNCCLSQFLNFLGYGKFARNKNSTCGIAAVAMFPCKTFF